MLERNQGRMQYAECWAMKIPIGGGTAESACNHVIGKRLKQSGMIWSERGAQGMLRIRGLFKSGRFGDDFEATMARAA